MITEQEINFLKKEKWGLVNDSDGSIQTNPTMLKKLNMPLEELNKDEANVSFIKSWIKRIQEKQNDKIISFVWDENKVITNKVFPMDLSKELFYYGILIPKNIDHEVRGKKIGKKQVWSPCLITSDKKLFEVDERLKEDHGINFENIPSSLPRRWNLEKIKSYLSWESEKVDPEKLLNKVTKQYEIYLFIRNPTWYKIHALWDIGTYLYQLFEAYPFLELRGIAGTGKSKCMSISSYISFNGGQIMVNPSESTLFRETDEVRGTKYFDEAEKLWVYNKSTHQYEGDVRTELINASYTKEAKVPRQEKILNKFVTKWYSPYSPTMLGSINGLFGATETRAITRITTKSSNEDQRGEKEPSEDRNETVWSDIRDECYRFALENWKELKGLYNNFPKEIGLKRRDYQIWKPILTIAKFISEDLFNEVVMFAKELTDRRMDDLIQESSFDYLCLNALRNTILNNQLSGKIYVNEIKLTYCSLKGDKNGETDIYLNRNISSHLDKLGFKEMRNKDRKGAFFSVNKISYDGIVAPVCPALAFLSSSIITSSHKQLKDNEKCDDAMTISDDKNKKSVTMMTISDENDDTYEKETFIPTAHELAKTGLNPEDLKDFSEVEQ